MTTKQKDLLTLALCIAVLPPLWAVLAPYLHIRTGAVALICAGLYVTNGNRLADATKISVGFLLGDLWAVITVVVTERLTVLPSDAVLFLTLAILGGSAVLISGVLERLIYCPAWLCGWAIGLTVLSPLGTDGMGTYPAEIAAAMLAGVWYVGAFLNAIQQRLAGKKGKETR